MSFKEQVSTLFLPYLAKGLPWQGCDSLFFIWLGINDIGNTYSRGGNTSALHGQLAQAYSSAVGELYNAGARNFVFLNVPPVDRSPLTMGQGAGAVELEKKALAEFNCVLEDLVDDFLEQHPDVHGLLFDTVPIFNKVLDDPEKYGFKVVNEFCKSYATYESPLPGALLFWKAGLMDVKWNAAAGYLLRGMRREGRRVLLA